MRIRVVFFAFFVASLVGCGGGGGAGKEAESSVSTVPASSSSLSSSVQLSSASSSSLNTISSSLSSGSVNIQPLAQGAGTFSTQFVIGGTYKIDEDTGFISKLENTFDGYYIAADIDSNGYVIAASASNNNVDMIDLLAGTAKTLFEAPEQLSAVAVASDGTIVAVSLNTEFSKKYIYRFTNSGEQLSKILSEDVNPNGIDFDSNGNLYGVNIFSTWKINPLTGKSTSVHLIGPKGQSDIDITSEGKLRIINSGKLEVYDLATGTQEKSLVLQHDYFAFSPLVHR
jgi:WD40 repeat protein